MTRLKIGIAVVLGAMGVATLIALDHVTQLAVAGHDLAVVLRAVFGMALVGVVGLAILTEYLDRMNK